MFEIPRGPGGALVREDLVKRLRQLSSFYKVEEAALLSEYDRVKHIPVELVRQNTGWSNFQGWSEALRRARGRIGSGRKVPLEVIHTAFTRYGGFGSVQPP